MARSVRVVAWMVVGLLCLATPALSKRTDCVSTTVPQSAKLVSSHPAGCLDKVAETVGIESVKAACFNKLLMNVSLFDSPDCPSHEFMAAFGDADCLPAEVIIANGSLTAKGAVEGALATGGELKGKTDGESMTVAVDGLGVPKCELVYGIVTADSTLEARVKAAFKVEAEQEPGRVLAEGKNATAKANSTAAAAKAAKSAEKPVEKPAAKANSTAKEAPAAAAAGKNAAAAAGASLAALAGAAMLALVL